MNIKWLGEHEDGTRSVEVRGNEISFDALVRHMKRIPGASVADAAENYLNDDARATIEYRGVRFYLESPFSDYIIRCLGPDAAFGEFVECLKASKVWWWEKFF